MSDEVRLMIRAMTILLSIALAMAAHAQQASIPPDRAAFESAQKVSDPQQKIAALNQLIADYPTSRYARGARNVIFETLIKRFPSRLTDIAHQIDAVLQAAPAENRYSAQDSMAHQLSDAGILLDRAQALAEEAVQAVRDRPAVDAHERAGMLATLGGIYLKRDGVADAERALRDAYRLHPTLSRAAEGLAEIALRQQHTHDAYDYLVRARLTGLLTADHQKALEALYSTDHHGSLEGFDAMLDDAHRTLFPPPVLVQPYVATGGRSDRLVLAELFTGSGCPPCAGADAAIDAMLERYGAKDFSALLYHIHVPRPDPMTNADTVKYAKYYGAEGTPMLFVDGAYQGGAAGSRDDAGGIYERIMPTIDKELDRPAEVQVAATAALASDRVKVHATVTAPTPTFDSNGVLLRVALVENQVRYSGENGVRFHPMVVRALVSQPAMTLDHEFDLTAVSASLKSYLDDFEQHNEEFGAFTFAEKKHAIDPDNLTIVAFVQDATSKHVLQATSTKVQPAQSASPRENPNPVHWSFADGPTLRVNAGQPTTVHLVAEIEPGWHLYGLDQPPGGPIATDIALAAGQPFEFAGPIDAPRGREIFDQNFGMKVELYTGRVEFRLLVKAASAATPGRQPLVVKVRYQSCSETICLPPRTVSIELPLEIRK